MKVEGLTRSGLIAIGLAGVAAGALLGFAAGMMYARDPQALRRTAGRYARETARGLERATLLASQAREHIGDLWAEAREEARAEVDDADFARAAQAAAAAAAAAAGAGAGARTGGATDAGAGAAKTAAHGGTAAPAAKRARKRRSPPARKTRAATPKTDTPATAE
jgi:hypothetical protein